MILAGINSVGQFQGGLLSVAIPILRNAFDVENKLASTASFFVKVVGPLVERSCPRFGSFDLPVFNLTCGQNCFFRSIGKSAD